MWLYPLPALLATFGFLFVLIERKNFLKEVRYAMVIVIAGIVIYLVRSWRRREWPFGDRGAPQAKTPFPEGTEARLSGT
jgi:hypothetical protein